MEDASFKKNNFERKEFEMKNPYVRVITLCVIQIFILAILFSGGIQAYIQSSNIYLFAGSSIFGSLIAIAATWLFYKMVDKKPLRTMNLKLNRKQMIFSVTSILLSVGLFFLVTMLLSKSSLVSAHFNRHFFTNINVIPMFFISAISWFLVGFNEELMYRGYMVANLKHLPLSKLIFLSSLFFAISHIFVDGINPIMILVTLSAAITLMYVYLKTGSLMAATIPHFIYDFLTRQLIGNSEISIMYITETPSDIYYAVLHVLFLVIQILLVMVIFRQKAAVSLKHFTTDSENISL